MTPYALKVYTDSYTERIKTEQEDGLIKTYLGAYWQRIKRLPSLKEVLRKEQPKKEMTPEEMLEEIKKINTSLGGTTY